MWESNSPRFLSAIQYQQKTHSTATARTIINIKGESYRLKEKRKAGLLTRSEPYTASEHAAPPEPPT